MRFALQIYSVQFGSRQVWLDVTHELRVGRTSRAELSVPEDPHISGVHFSLHDVDGELLLKDLQSRNGTFVNGAKVGSIVLQDGDVIIAGKTQFQVVLRSELPGTPGGPAGRTSQSESYTPGVPTRSISGSFDYEQTESFSSPFAPPHPGAPQAEADAGGEVGYGANYPRLSSRSFRNVRRHAGMGSDFTEQSPVEKQHPSPEPPAQRPSIAGPMQTAPHSRVTEGATGLPIRYETRLAPSGMTYFCPRSDVKPPIEVADFIGRNRFLYGLVNVSRLLPHLQASIYNEATAAGAVAVSRTQLLVPKRDVLAFHGLMQRCWGQDAMVCLASRLNKVEFMNLAYRLTAQLESPASLLDHLYSDGQFVNYGYLDGISAVLLEMERGARWIIFKNDSEIRTWRTLGFPCPPELVG